MIQHAFVKLPKPNLDTHALVCNSNTEGILYLVIDLRTASRESMVGDYTFMAYMEVLIYHLPI